VPRRRCVGCARIAPKSELVRIAAVPHGGARRSQRAVIDTDGQLPGRGAYLCRGAGASAPNPDCLQHALRRGGIARTLRRAVKFELADPPIETANS
jgi:predicted RNA-binding protein YlxR (DUF448 family)